MAQTTVTMTHAAAATTVERTGSLFWVSTLRVVAAFAVVVLHTAHFFVMSHDRVAPLDWWAGNWIDSAVRWCVPLFVLVSGALLLDPGRKEDALTFARKRARRVFWPLVFWTAIFLMWRIYFDHLSAGEVKSVMLQGIPFYHLWYLYMVPGLYLLTPFLRSYIRGSTSRERWYLVGILLALTTINALVNYFVRQDTQSVFTLFVPYIAYYLAGYQLRTLEPGRVSVRLLGVLFLVCTTVTALGTWLLVNRYGLSPESFYFYDYFSLPVMVAALCVFLIGRQALPTVSRVPASVEQFVTQVDPASLGIYVVHALLLAILQEIGGLDPARINPLPGIPLIAMLVFGGSYLLTRLLMRTPVLRHTVL